jgi:hypothetical protein
VTIGIVLKKDGKNYTDVQMKDAMKGISVGVSFQGGVQGGLVTAIDGKNAYGEIGLVSDAGIQITVVKTNPLFNINE